MSKPWEVTLGAVVSCLVAAVFFGFSQVRENSLKTAGLEATQREGVVLRDQNFARLQIVERLLNEQWPSMLDTKLQKVLDRVVSVDDKLSAIQQEVVRLKTKMEDRK